MVASYIDMSIIDDWTDLLPVNFWTDLLPVNFWNCTTSRVAHSIQEPPIEHHVPMLQRSTRNVIHLPTIDMSNQLKVKEVWYIKLE